MFLTKNYNKNLYLEYRIKQKNNNLHMKYLKPYFRQQQKNNILTMPMDYFSESPDFL